MKVRVGMNQENHERNTKARNCIQVFSGSIALYHSPYLFFPPTEDQQAVEKCRENSGMCREKGRLMDTAFWWMKFAAISFRKGGVLDGMNIEEKFSKGEVFSNSSDDTKLENHVQSFPSGQCWISLQK